jgi:glycosyltransferase involved in cell wall biosynthesis
VDYPLKNRLRYRFTYNGLADHILANSVATKRSLLVNAPWLKPDRIEVIYKGIDPAPYLESPDDGLSLRRELGIAYDSPLVGFVGQIIERKGIPDLVWSIPRVVERMPAARFLFVGEGKLVEFLLAKARELGVEGNVIHAGFRQDIPAVMKAIDLLVLPSVVEGFGYVLVEAMAAGKPVVATNVSSIPEIVQDDETGVLVDVHDPDRLAAAMIDVLAREDRGRAMGERGRRVMLEKFTLHRMIDRIEAAFLAVRARKRGAGIDSA